MDTFNCKEQSKKQEVGARGKIVNKEEAGSKNQTQTVLTLDLDQITKFI
jgi:hypothetical protein